MLVGTVSSAASPLQGRIELLELHLNGTVIDPARTRQIHLGTTANTGGALIATLPDGRVLVIATDAQGALTAGPMANHVAAIVDLSSPTPQFTLLPDPPGSGVGGGLVVDPTGRFAYYALTAGMGSPSGVASLYRFDLTTHQACVIGTWPGSWAKGLVIDDDGSIYLGLNDGTTLAHSVWTVTPNGCQPVTSSGRSSSLILPPSVLGLDRTNARFVCATPPWAPGLPASLRNSLVVVDRATGTASVLAAPPPSGWGMLSGLAVTNWLDSHGPASDGANRYWFENLPNPGGQPDHGRTGVSLTLRSDPGTALLSVFALSTDHASIPVAGITLLLDPAAMLAEVVSSADRTTLTLPIPADPNLVGVAVHTQSIHVESDGRLAASRGLRIEIR